MERLNCRAAYRRFGIANATPRDKALRIGMLLNSGRSSSASPPVTVTLKPISVFNRVISASPPRHACRLRIAAAVIKPLAECPHRATAAPVSVSSNRVSRRATSPLKLSPHPARAFCGVDIRTANLRSPSPRWFRNTYGRGFYRHRYCGVRQHDFVRGIERFQVADGAHAFSPTHRMVPTSIMSTSSAIRLSGFIGAIHKSGCPARPANTGNDIFNSS